MKSVEGKIRKAVAQYGLIEAGDCVAVGLSGGKDSLAMLVGLAGLMKYSEIPFSLRAVTLDMCFGGKDTDFSPVTKLCESMGVEHIVKRTNLAEVIFDIRKEQNPCALCSRMRRGALHDMSIECGCNKIALGHHMDDVVETLFMNLFNEGRLETFRPKTYLSRKNIELIRPLIFCTEREVENASSRATLPVVKSLCPKDGHSERQKIKDFISLMDAQYPDFLQRTFTAIQKGDISGFGLK